MEIELKCLSESDNLSDLSIKKVDWDVVIDGESQQVVAIDDRPHGEGSSYGLNCYYVYPLDEVMSIDNLTPYWGIKGGVSWGIHFEYNNYYRAGNGFTKQDEIREGGQCWITRNGEKFYEVSGRKHEYALAKAQTLIVEIEESGWGFFNRNWEKNFIGRKVYYNNQPAKIERICEGQGAMIIVPDGIEAFEPQVWQIDENESKEECMAENGLSVKADIFSPHIWWFRE